MLGGGHAWRGDCQCEKKQERKEAERGRNPSMGMVIQLEHAVKEDSWMDSLACGLEDSPRLKAGDSLELLCDMAARLQRCFLFRRHVLGLALKSYRVSTDYHRASLG